MFCAAITKKGTECKLGIASGCTVREGDYLHYLCRHHYNRIQLGSIFSFSEERRTFAPAVTTTKEEAVNAATSSAVMVRIFTIVSAKTYNEVLNFFFSAKETRSVSTFAEAREYALSLDHTSPRFKGFLIQLVQGGDTYKVRLDGTWAKVEGAGFVVRKDRYTN